MISSSSFSFNHHLHEQRCSSKIETMEGKEKGTSVDKHQSRDCNRFDADCSSLPVVSAERTHALCP